MKSSMYFSADLYTLFFAYSHVSKSISRCSNSVHRFTLVGDTSSPDFRRSEWSSVTSTHPDGVWTRTIFLCGASVWRITRFSGVHPASVHVSTPSSISHTSLVWRPGSSHLRQTGPRTYLLLSVQCPGSNSTPYIPPKSAI